MAQGYFTTGSPTAVGQLPLSAIVPVDGASGPEAAALIQVSAGFLPGNYSENTSTGSFTVSGAEVAGAAHQILALTGTLSGDATVTMPGVTDLVTAIPGAFAGLSWVLRVINSSSAAHQWTVAGNATVVVQGTATIAQGTWREFLATFGSGLGGATLQNIGGGTV